MRNPTARICRLMTAGIVGALQMTATAVADVIDVPADQPSIQAAISAAVSGVDEVVVAPGFYPELINLQGKVITVRSSGGAAVTEINGNFSDTVIRCMSGETPDTVIDGFTIRHGVALGGGGGIRCQNSSPTVRNCVLRNNESGGGAVGGGGMYNFNASPTVVNCVFAQNTSQGPQGGGAILNASSSPLIVNCTIVENMATSGPGGGMHNTGPSFALIENCIIWDNFGGGGINDNPPASSTVNYSDVPGWFGAGTNNISADPSFVGVSFDLRLDRYSPCADAGDNDAVPAGVTGDLDDDPRFADDGGVADTGNPGVPGPPVVDMGAYERQLDSTPLIFDIDPGDSIQATINGSFDGDEIIAAPGTYDQVINFLGKAIVLRSSGGPLVTFLDGTGLDNSVVRCVTSEGPDTVLEGFTILGGAGSNVSGLRWGGGMYNAFSSPTVRGCVFTGNAADDGGGMTNEGAGPTVTDCVFSTNAADFFGGGMVNFSGSTPLITGCTFSGNSAFDGGGLASFSGSAPVIAGTSFANNSASFGGAVYCGGGSLDADVCVFDYNVALFAGGGLYDDAADVDVAGCVFLGNDAMGEAGGGIFALANSADATADIVDCVFDRNSSLEGGAFWIFGEFMHVSVARSRFHTNSATAAGGAVYAESTSPVFTNCEFVNNRVGCAGYLGDGDTCQTPILMAGGTASGTTADNTASPIVPSCGFSDGPDEWLCWTSRCEGFASFSLCSSDFDTVLAIYPDTCQGAAIDCDDDGCPGSAGSLIENVPVVQGQQVLIRVGGFGGQTGNYELSAGCTGLIVPDTGGAIYSTDGGGAIGQCTFVGNSARFTGAVAAFNSSVSIDNSVFHQNSATGIGGSGVTVNSSNVPGGWNGNGANNIDANPFFVDPDGPDDVLGTIDDDVRLFVTSPCIDAGDNALVPAGVTTDLEGTPRIIDGDLDFVATVDMGAYEHAPDALSQVLNVTRGTLHPSIAGAIAGADDGDVLLSILGPFGFEPQIDFAGLALTLRSVGGVDQPSGGLYALADDARLETATGFALSLAGELRVEFGDRVELAAALVSIDPGGELNAFAGSVTDIEAAGGLVNGGALTLLGGNLGVTGGLHNDATGTLTVFGTVQADVTNDHQAFYVADTQVIGDYVNNDVTTVQSGVLTILGSLTNNGTIIGDVAGGAATGGGQRGLAVFGDFAAGAAAALRLPSSSMSLRLAGDFDVAIDDNTAYDMADAELRMIAPFGETQTLEVMSLDVGPDPSGLDRTLPGHYPLGVLRIGPAGTTASMVDAHDNDGLGQTACEAIYVNALVIDAGAMLITNGCRVYYGSITLDGDVDDEAALVEIDMTAPCPGDVDESGDVGFSDLLAVLSGWGPCAGCPEDVDGDDDVGFADLLIVLSSWGPCPE